MRSHSGLRHLKDSVCMYYEGLIDSGYLGESILEDHKRVPSLDYDYDYDYIPCKPLCIMHKFV